MDIKLLLVLAMLALSPAAIAQDTSTVPGLCNSGNIDKDKDGLIEICSLEGIDAMRYELEGAGYTTSTGATKITEGCKTGGCIGYELTRNLDFLDDASYATTANKMEWTVESYGNSSDTGWQAIGDGTNRFVATFDGNSYTIANLMINSTLTSYIGLFGSAGTGAKIFNVALLNIDVRGGNNTGGLVGFNSQGIIANNHVTGKVSGTNQVGSLVGQNFKGVVTNNYATGTVSGTSLIGGLTGSNAGTVMNSYATGTVSGTSLIGGLVGFNSQGIIENSYATGKASGLGGVGGLVGQNHQGSVTNSYWDIQTSAKTGSGGGRGLMTKQMQTPQAPGVTSGDVYYNWSSDDWDFGNSSQYPASKRNDGSGALLGRQRYQLADLVMIEGDRRITLDPKQSDHIIAAQLTRFSVIASTATAATITIDGQSVQSGQKKIFDFETRATSKTVTIVTTPQSPQADLVDSSTSSRIYTIKARQFNSELSGLTVSAGTLRPPFNKEVTSYTMRVDNSNTTITVTPTAQDFDADVSVDGKQLNSGQASDTIDLVVGATNTITIAVTSKEPQTTTYIITVLRLPPSSDTSLRKLRLSAGSLNPTFPSNTTTYTSVVSVESIKVIAEATHAHATITVNGAAVSSGQPSQAITLNISEPSTTTTVVIVVTAQDGTTDTYTLILRYTPGIRIRAKVLLEGALQ